MPGTTMALPAFAGEAFQAAQGGGDGGAVEEQVVVNGSVTEEVPRLDPAHEFEVGLTYHSPPSI